VLVRASASGKRVDGGVFGDSDDVHLGDETTSATLLDRRAQRQSREEGEDKSEDLHLVD
jgi:hypothetical protein